MSSQSVPLSKTEERPESHSSFARGPLFFSARQDRHGPALQQLSPGHSRHVLEFVPLVAEKETLYLDAVSLNCMDDLRLPRCLSPLEPCASAAKSQPILKSVNLGNNIQQGHPWLMENSCSPQYPLSFPQEMDYRDGLEPHQDFDGGTQAECCTVEELDKEETISGQQNMLELMSEPRRTKGSLKRKSNTAGGTLTPKSKKTKDTSESEFLSAHQDMKVADGNNVQINLNKCSVSLSSNNVLAKERDKATSSISTTSTFVAKPNWQSTIRESLRERPKESRVSTVQTQIRTRGSMKRTQQSPIKKNAQNFSVQKPAASRATTVNNRGVFPHRKRGRPRKERVEELPVSDVKDEKSHNGESLQQVDMDLPKQDPKKGDTTNTNLENMTSNGSTGAEMKTINTESTDSNNNDMVPAPRKARTATRPRLTILKEFQRLIKLQHSKSRKSVEGKETNETVGSAESDVITCKDSTGEETRETKIDVDIRQPQNEDRSEESPPAFSVTVGEAEKEKDTDKYTSKETSLSGDDLLFSCDVLQETGRELEGEREQPVKNHEGEMLLLSYLIIGTFDTKKSY